MSASTRLYSHPLLLKHGRSDHSECPARLEEILTALSHTSAQSHLILDSERSATPAELALAHDLAYVTQVLSLAGQSGQLDYETFLSPDSVAAACRAVGLGLEATEKVLRGELRQAFVLVRPPGHHAGRRTGMGFCVFNNIAIAAKAALASGLERILILDWDVHHGNGTQEIFYDDPHVFHVDFHEDSLFPTTSGTTQETGEGPGKGFTLNLPLPGGSGDFVYWHAFDHQVLDRARQFRPELILVSAGFDGHAGDPEGNTELTTPGYVGLVKRAQALAREVCDGKLILFLEGGYDLTHLSQDVLGCTAALLEND